MSIDHRSEPDENERREFDRLWRELLRGRPNPTVVTEDGFERYYCPRHPGSAQLVLVTSSMWFRCDVCYVSGTGLAGLRRVEVLLRAPMSDTEEIYVSRLFRSCPNPWSIGKQVGSTLELTAAPCNRRTCEVCGLRSWRMMAAGAYSHLSLHSAVFLSYIPEGRWDATSRRLRRNQVNYVRVPSPGGGDNIYTVEARVGRNRLDGAEEQPGWYESLCGNLSMMPEATIASSSLAWPLSSERGQARSRGASDEFDDGTFPVANIPRISELAIENDLPVGGSGNRVTIELGNVTGGERTLLLLRLGVSVHQRTGGRSLPEMSDPSVR